MTARAMPAPAAPAGPWSSIEIATRRERVRVPFVIDGVAVGSVAAEHLDALRPWAPGLRVERDAVVLTVSADRRDDTLATLNAALREQGLIRAWRDETYPLPHPATLQVLAHFERAASRFWGTLTFGAHGTGWVAGADGRPAARAARRSPSCAGSRPWRSAKSSVTSAASAVIVEPAAMASASAHRPPHAA